MATTVSIEWRRVEPRTYTGLVLVSDGRSRDIATRGAGGRWISRVTETYADPLDFEPTHALDLDAIPLPDVGAT